MIGGEDKDKSVSEFIAVSQKKNPVSPSTDRKLSQVGKLGIFQGARSRRSRAPPQGVEDMAHSDFLLVLVLYSTVLTWFNDAQSSLQ